MFSMISGIFRLFGLLLLGVLLASCGGGGGGDDGGFTPEGINVTITADKTTLQTNLFSGLPNPSRPFTNTITVQVTKSGNLYPAENVAIDIVSGLASGSLYYLDGDPAHEECPAVTPDTCPPVETVPLAYRRLVFEKTTGTVTGHFHASSTPGTVVLRASAQDPNTKATVTADMTITVGPGVSTGQPAVVRFVIPSDPLYITGQGRQDVKRFQVAVLDDANQPVPNPTGNNLRLQLLPSRPNGGEKLVAISASGNNEQGDIVNTRTINGVAEVALHSGNKPGTVVIAAIADRADNNVDNGIQSSVSDVDTIPISSGEIASLTFTGPYPGAVVARANELTLGSGDTIDNTGAVYTRAITVLAVDEFGNPPPPGEFVTFRLMDGPMTGYPTLGRGTFTIAGDDGNPQEGQNTFTTPAGGSSLLGASTNCQLVLEGGAGQEGSWLINGQSQAHLLAVFNTFNPVANTGFTVPYTIGCPPYTGNVANSINDVVVQTDADGIASTIMNYPRTQLGRCFKLTAEANGGRVGAVMGKEKLGNTVSGDPCTSWYLGIPTGSTLSVIPASDQNLQVPVGGTLTDKEITIQLLDGGKQQCDDQGKCVVISPPAPLPAERLSVQVVITDPDQAAVATAEAAVATAQAAETAVQAAIDAAGCPAVAPDDPTDEPAVCPGLRAALVAAQTALVQAQLDLELANARDALHNPAATFEPDPLVTGVEGIAVMTITVSDLYTAASTGGTGDAQVQFFINTVGPEIRAATLTITVLPQGAAPPAP